MLPLRRVTLPGPLTVWAPSLFEARVLYREIVGERTYEKCGIGVQKGDTVFDVGANIGLFALHLSRTVPGIRVHAFEPLPDIYEALRRNLDEHAPEARSYNVGLAGKPGEAIFEFDRFSTMTSSMHPSVFEDGADKSASAAKWAAAALADLEKIDPEKSWVRLVRNGLEKPALRMPILIGLASGTLALRLRRRLFLRHRNCKLQTLSRALVETEVATVDLVKIDVEGAEESILAGIAEPDWDHFRQFVIEAHDVGGRLHRMTGLLERHGYRTFQAREDWAMHELLGIWTLYAIRP